MNQWRNYTKPRCSVDGCGRLVKARLLCQQHYERWRRTGTTDLRERPTLAENSPLRYGLTYRQLDYWTRRGYLTAEQSHPGTGYRRCWPPSEIEVAGRMKRLIDGGMSVMAAVELARLGAGRHEVAPGVVVEVGAP